MMEDKSAAAGDFPRAPPSSAEITHRQVFHVDLQPGETTIVSWKKLLRDANKAGGPISSDPEPPAMAHSSLESRITSWQPAENEVKDASAPHRFSAVIEKIERLYMGKHSSDEEDLNGYPDNDQYDTEDSFIDDAELDEYFEVDNSEIKHDGFFVNRGQLEHISEPTISSNQQMRKRRRKDFRKASEENGNVHILNKHVKLNKVASGKEAPQKNERLPDLKSLDQLNASGDPLEKKSTEAAITLDESSLATVSNGDNSASHAEPKKLKKQKLGTLQSKNFGNKWEHANEPFEISHQKYLHKKASVKPKSHFATPLPDKRAFKYPPQTTKTLHMHKKDGSSVKPKGALLERAIRELQRMVAESRPPSVENQETDSSSQMMKRRLPTEIKLKLARVARLALARHGKLTNELVDRLMSILGHFIQLRTLKRKLKSMISMGVSAKHEKDDRFQQIKKEIKEMVKMQITSLEAEASDMQSGRSDDLKVGSEGKGVPKRKASMDTALEDKMCDLYDLFVDGLDEDAGPQIRKLYTELAELWPSGIMNSHGVRYSICRAKERRGTLYDKQKRKLKSMISMGVSAKQEKDDRFQQIKKEITDMVKMQITSLEAEASDKQSGRSDDLKVGSEGKGVPKRKASMDTALEDKMCDLYDLFVDGLDEDAGPQIRKLYTELAELWPSGIMNSHGVRHSICRAKERRGTLYDKQKDEKSKKMLPPISKETLVQPQHVQEKLRADSDACGSVPTVKPVSTLSNGPDTDKPKLKETSGDSPADARVSESDSTKKKVKKRKPRIQLDESHVCGERNGTSPTGTGRPFISDRQ